MARTLAADFDQKGEAIIDRAVELFAIQGFLGTSIADIAVACKISKSLIYHYYGSKEDILFAAMSTHVEALAAEAEDVLGSHGTAEDKLRRLARGFMALYVGATDRHKVLLNDLASLPEERQKVIVGRQRELISAVEKLFVDIWPDIGERKGILRAKTMLFFGMINWTHTWFNPEGPISASGIADMACDHILAVRD
jgi:AcrR family transcriptional regulator